MAGCHLGKMPGRDVTLLVCCTQVTSAHVNSLYFVSAEAFDLDRHLMETHYPMPLIYTYSTEQKAST